MKITLGKGRGIVSKPVQLGAGEEIHLHVRAPSYAELIEDMGKFENFIEPRIKCVVVGWAGLVQDVTAEDGTVTEQEIPYSYENLQALCELYPVALKQIAKIVHQAYNGGEPAKNASPASALFSADAVMQQLGLPNGSPSAALPASAPPPD